MGKEIGPKDPVPANLISVVLPAYNEEEALGREIDTIRSGMAKTPEPYEFIVVNDGSKDRTGEVAQDKGVRVLTHEVNRGVGAARKTGILEARGEIIVTSDADGTYPHEEIPKLLACFPDCDMAVGARIGAFVQEPWYRRTPKFFIRKLASRLSDVEIPDLNSGLRVFKKSTATRYFSLLPNGHSWEGTITLSFLCNGHPVKFVPINYFKRKGGHSTFHPVRDTYSFIILVIRTAMYFHPLRALLPPAFFLCGSGMAKMAYDFTVYRHVGGVDVSIFLTGVMLAIAGFLADLLIMLHKKDPPRM